MVNLRHLRTARLELRAIRPDDVDLLYALNADPRVWTHFPAGVHQGPEKTAAQVARQRTAWEQDGLGYWTAWTHDGSFAGVGGCSVNAEVAWNLYYRFTPEAQGHGFARELARAAIAAAQALRPALPVTALLLEHNLASKSVAEKSGLNLAWRGPDKGNPDPDAVRLVYADRKLTPEIVRAILTRP
jgi:RimJ/RimL family protein N-acetyltransferase